MINTCLFVLGVSFGSFVSALSWRYPKGISIARGRSMCPKCKYQISWFDNIPLLSFLILGGKCRHCRKKISPRYPLIEMATAIGFVVVYYFTTTFKGQPLQGAVGIASFIYALLIFLIFVLIFVIDFEHRIIPDPFVFFGIVLTVISLLLIDSNLIFYNIFAGFFPAFLLLLIHLVTRGRGMGLGDVKFAVLGGMLVGPNMSLMWLFLAFLTGGVIGIILILGKKAGLKSQIAFGPFLITAIPLTLLYGEKILFWLHIN